MILVLLNKNLPSSCISTGLSPEIGQQNKCVYFVTSIGPLVIVVTLLETLFTNPSAPVNSITFPTSFHPPNTFSIITNQTRYHLHPVFFNCCLQGLLNSFFRHARVSSTYPCQLVGWLVGWLVTLLNFHTIRVSGCST